MRVSVVTRRSLAASVLGLGLVLGGAAQAQYATVELAVKDRKFEPAEIKVPTLIVRGEWDSYSTDADAKWLFDSLKQAPVKRDVVHHSEQQSQ